MVHSAFVRVEAGSEFTKSYTVTFVITDLDSVIAGVRDPDTVKGIHIYTQREVKLATAVPWEPNAVQFVSVSQI